MTQLINEAKRMQKLAGLITESQLNEESREGVYNDFSKWKASFPEGTEFKQENNYVVATKEGKELGKWNPISIKGMHADDFQYKNLEEVETIKADSNYVASMPAVASDFEPDTTTRIDVRVKALEVGDGDDMIRVKALENKRYTDPTNKLDYAYQKDGEYTVRAKYIKPAGANESIEQAVNEALKAFRKGK
jgi:hypothetical protein